MKIALSFRNNKIVTFNDMIASEQGLRSVGKIRIEAKEPCKNEPFPFEHDKIYHLPTPYNSFGAAELLMNTLKTSGK